MRIYREDEDIGDVEGHGDKEFEAAVAEGAVAERGDQGDVAADTVGLGQGQTGYHAEGYGCDHGGADT